MANQNNEAVVENNEEVQNETTSVENDIVELEWEEVEGLYALREEVAGLHSYLSNMMLQFEKTKKTLVDKAVDMEANLFEQAQSIREAKNVGSEDTYELKLPNKPNEKGYLVKK